MQDVTKARPTTLAELTRLQLLPVKPQPEFAPFPFIKWHADNVHLAVEHPGGGDANYILCATHLCENAALIFHSCYLHPNTECVARLEQLRGSTSAYHGVIAACWHAHGKIHTSILRFDKPIDLARHVPREHLPKRAEPDAAPTPPLTGESLSIQASPFLDRMVAHLCTSIGLTNHALDDPGDAFDHVRKRPVDLIVTDSAIGDAPDFVSGMRNVGYSGRFLVLASAADIQTLIAAGADMAIKKPFDPHEFTECVRELLAENTAPETLIGSSLLPEHPIEKLLADYIGFVRETASTIRNAAAKKNTPTILARARDLHETGISFGYLPLSEAAHALVECLVASSDLAAAAPALQALDRVCAQLRPVPDSEAARQSKAPPSPRPRPASDQSLPENDPEEAPH